MLLRSEICLFLLVAGLAVTPRLSESSSPTSGSGEGEERGSASPLVMVGILARNTAHTLPDFLGYLESLDYPKHRMKIW